MQPGSKEDSPITSSPEPSVKPHTQHQHGLLHFDEPPSGPSQRSDIEHEGPVAGRIAGNTVVPSRQPFPTRLSQSSSPELLAVEDVSAKVDYANLTEKISKNRGRTNRTIARPKVPSLNGLHLLDLPNEILTHVLSYLPAETLTASALVCHRFHQLVTTPHAWRDAFLRYFPGVLSSSSRTGKERKNDTSTLGGRAFTRLTALASWRSEYILRTRLLRSLARGKPPAPNATVAQPGSKVRQALGTVLFESQQVDIVDRLQGDFGNGVDGRRPRFRYGTTYVGRLGHSDPANNAPDNWGLRENNLFTRFDRDFFGLAQPYGLGEGEVVGVANPMDVSQSFGAIHGEGVPGGRIYFHHAQEKEGRFIHSERPNIASPTDGVPFIDPESESICSVWIAKNSNVPNFSNGLLGMLSGASSGIVTAYSLGTDGVTGRRMQRGELTAKWAICPGVPIIHIKVDDSYNMKRYGGHRVLVMVLNALGEVYYLKDLFFQPESPPDKPNANDLNTLAWRTGRSVKWGLVSATARIPATSDGDYNPRSSWFGLGLSPERLQEETREIERYVKKKPKHFREMCFGWDMQRRLEVDFAGDDEHGAGEAVLVFECGIKDGMSLPLRATRFVRRCTISGAEIPETSVEGNYASQRSWAGSPDRSRGKLVLGDPDPASDLWMQSDFCFSSIDAEVVTTAIDCSSFAMLTIDEDPLLNLSASTTSSPWASPTAAMPRPSTASEIPGHRARLVVAGTNQGSIILWDIRAPVAPSAELTNTVMPLQIIRTDSPCISCLSLSALYLVHGGTDGLVQAWDPLGSQAWPVRTLNSRYSIRSRHRFVMAGTTPQRAGYDFFVAGAIALDPDATTLRGMVTLGSLLRYWFYSSDATDQYKRSKRRWRKGPRSGQRDAETNYVPRGSMKYWIEDEYQEMQAEQRADQKEQARMADRFGIGLLGPGATEAEMLAYATLLSTEAEERRNFGRATTPPAAQPDEEADKAVLVSRPDPAASVTDLDVHEAIRRSLQDQEQEQDSSPESFSIRYKRDKRRSPKSGSPKNGSPAARAVATAGLPGSSRSADADDMEFALQLSLAQEQSRVEADAKAVAALDDWEEVEMERKEKRKGKGKARD